MLILPEYVSLSYICHFSDRYRETKISLTIINKLTPEYLIPIYSQIDPIPQTGLKILRA